VVNSLGMRRDARSVGAIAELFGNADATVAAAAAEALGKIATPDAAVALAKARVAQAARNSLHNAQLQCAERLAAAGNAALATEIYERIWSSNEPAACRMAGLVGLAKVAPEKAAPAVLATLDSDDPLLQATAARLAGQLPGKETTAALVDRLTKLDPGGQVLVLGMLARRGDRSAEEAVARLTAAEDQAVRVAAVQAMADLGGPSAVEPLVRLAAAERGPVQQAARTSLARARCADIEQKLLSMASSGEPAARAEVFRALAARANEKAVPILLEAADSRSQTSAALRCAALDALAVLAPAESHGKLVALLVAAPTPDDAEAAERAVAATGGRIGQGPERVAPVIVALSAAPVQAKPLLLRVLAGFGGPEGLEAVRGQLVGSDAALRDAAVRALAAWPDASAAADLLKITQGSENEVHRVLALRGYLRLVGEVPDGSARLKMLEQIRPIATDAAAKRMLLAALSQAPDAGGLQVAADFLGDAEVHGEAAAATLAIARAVVRIDPDAVRAAMRKLIDSTKDEQVAKQAVAMDEEAQKTPSPAAEQQALQRDQKRSDAQKAALAKLAPKGFHLACYLNCGPDTADGAKGGPLLRRVAGGPYFWGESIRVADPRFGAVFFDGQRVVFEASGLNPKRAYQIGFTWWDFDHDTRAQSVLMATGKGERETTALAKTRLPSGANKQGPEEKTLPVPRGLYADGSMRITFRNENVPNAVVSELWLWESDAEESPTLSQSTADQQPKPNILLVTGQELHDWRATTPVLVHILEKDPRLRVRVVEDPSFLADPSIHNYDAIVMNWMNWKAPSPGPEARENFKRYVAKGGGVVMIHFACGAWQDWPEFREIVGRVWDPKLRAHDPRGPFRVTMTDVKSPIIDGLQAFEADDELYTCLAGDRPVEVLAVARSKVDQKDYPMALTHRYGKGRVYQCLLGHDVKAMRMPGVDELYRRGCAWAAGLPPVAGK
jgi:type 1 glutamine amidotransferase/HEAT repeat protein